jgi:hypothetical protein
MKNNSKLVRDKRYRNSISTKGYQTEPEISMKTIQQKKTEKEGEWVKTRWGGGQEKMEERRI